MTTIRDWTDPATGCFDGAKIIARYGSAIRAKLEEGADLARDESGDGEFWPRAAVESEVESAAGISAQSCVSGPEVTVGHVRAGNRFHDVLRLDPTTGELRFV